MAILVRSIVNALTSGKVGLTWHNPNPLIMVGGPEIEIEPVGIRRLPAGVAQVEGGDA